MTLPVGFSSVTWSTDAIVVIMFKRSYVFPVRMIFAFVFIIILFPSEIQSCCKSTVGLRLPSAASGPWRQQGSPRGAGWVPPVQFCSPWMLLPGAAGQAKSSLPSAALPEQPSLLLEACKVPAKILRLEEC